MINIKNINIIISLMLIIGKEYSVNSPYGHSGIYTLSEINLNNNKDSDVMYIFEHINGYKVGFINRLYKSWKMEITPYERPKPLLPQLLPPSPPSPPSELHIQPNMNINFYCDDL